MAVKDLMSQRTGFVHRAGARDAFETDTSKFLRRFGQQVITQIVAKVSEAAWLNVEHEADKVRRSVQAGCVERREPILGAKDEELLHVHQWQRRSLPTSASRL